jgi:4-amino-4-deoxy-L-arabinose transferase-like glycosyltransferase
VGARTVSNLAACGLALTAFGFGARLRDRRAGLWSMGLVIANPNVWIFGEQAATDMLFACLAAAALLAGLAYLRRPSAGAALAAGVAAALAAWVRGNAALLVPPLLVAWALSSRDRRRPAHLALALGAAVVVLAPLWWLRWRLFGAPFYDDNSRNLWWKLYAHGDWSLLERAPPSSFKGLVLGAPLAIVTSALREFGRFFTGELPPLMGGWWSVPPLAVAAVTAVRARRREPLLLLAALAIFTFGVAAVFFTSVRLMLVWIPVASALAIGACHELAQTLRPSDGRRWATAASVVLVALTLAGTSLSRLPAFVGRHPYAEVAALRPLDRELGADQALAGTAPFLQRYLTHRYVHLTDETGLSGVDDYHDWLSMQRLLRAAQVKYVVASDIELRQRPRALLGQGSAAPPPGLELVRRDAHLALWRVRDVP